jgi:hypothetical protein
MLCIYRAYNMSSKSQPAHARCPLIRHGLRPFAFERPVVHLIIPEFVLALTFPSVHSPSRRIITSIYLCCADGLRGQ